MRPDLVTIIERVAGLRGEIAANGASEALLERIEDVLSEGYAWVLAGDAWSARAEQRVGDLISGTLGGGDARELRVLATEQARCQRELAALREELAELRRDRHRVATRSSAASS